MASSRTNLVRGRDPDELSEETPLSCFSLVVGVIEYVGPILYVTIALCISMVIFVAVTSSRHPDSSSTSVSLDSRELLVAVTASMALTIPIFFDIMVEWYIKNKDHDFVERQIIIVAINTTNIFLCSGDSSVQFTSILFCESLLSFGATISLLNKYLPSVFTVKRSLFCIVIAFVECFFGLFCLASDTLQSIEFGYRIFLISLVVAIVLYIFGNQYLKFRHSNQRIGEFLKGSPPSELKASIIAFALLIQICGYSIFPHINTIKDSWVLIGDSYLVVIILIQTLFAIIIAHGMSGELKLVSANLNEKLDIKRTFVRYIGHEIR